MSRTRMLTLLALSVLGSMPGYSQQKAIQSGSADAKLLPGAGNGGSGTVFSPDLFNGTANVSIPIYSYGNEGISLSYNTAGVKVDEPSGPVGQHWNLGAGGSIVRVMKDMPDEVNTSYTLLSYPGGGTPSGAGSDEFRYGISGRWRQYFGGTVAPNNDGDRYQDQESDDFMVSVGGLSFTFTIGQNGFVFTHPHQNIKVELLLNGTLINGSTPGVIPIGDNTANLNFRIRDAQGNWYYFEQGDRSRKTFGPMDEPSLVCSYISRWVIKKIVKNDGLQVEYEYTYNEHNFDETGVYMSFSGMENSNAAPVVSGTLIKVADQLVSSARIASIKYPNSVTASFVYTADYYRRCDCQPVNTGYPNNKGDQILREIQISSGFNVMRYVFDQAYALSQKNGLPAQKETPLGSCYDVTGVAAENYRYHRLILKGIHIENENGTQTEPYYKFGYNAMRLPPRFSGAQDYFGYYNGITVTENGGMLNIPRHVPKYGPSSTQYGVSKADNISYAVAGILDTVINAYGGMTLFSYDAHSLNNVISHAGITLPTDDYFLGSSANDGVRVASIKTIDPKYPGRYQQQTFAYINGQRFIPGGYFDYPVYTLNTGSPIADNHYTNTLFNGTYISPHQLINGSNHGYTSVSITNSSDAGQLSRSETTFQNISRGISPPHDFLLQARYQELF